MTQYIDKNKVETILRNLWKQDDGHNSEHRICYNKALQEVQCEIDTLEVKEVDFEKEVIDWWNAHYSSKAYTFEGYSGHYLENSTVINIAKHFFELGLKYRKENNNGL
jgi:hypothetical protein